MQLGNQSTAPIVLSSFWSFSSHTPHQHQPPSRHAPPTPLQCPDRSEFTSASKSQWRRRRVYYRITPLRLLYLFLTLSILLPQSFHPSINTPPHRHQLPFHPHPSHQLSPFHLVYQSPRALPYPSQTPSSPSLPPLL